MNRKYPFSNRLKLVTLLPLLCISLYSCEKFAKVDLPVTQLSAQQVFQSEATANAVLSSLYVSASTLASGGSNSVSFYGFILADESDTWNTSTAFSELANNQLSPTSSYATTLWSSSYTLIYGCNSLLEGIKDNPVLSASSRKQLEGEALFLRGLAHLQLTSFFGTVPIVLSTDYRDNTQLAASASPTVFQSIFADLEKAATLLPADYAGYGNERIRPNATAAKALLARAYLYAGEHAKAEIAASEVIASPLYALLPLTEVFLKNSRETLLAYKPLTTQYTADGNLYVLTGKPAVVSLKNSFVQNFAASDLRRIAWTSKITVSGIDYPFPNKYKVKTATAITEYSIMLRLAETYLIRAEARARQHKTDLSVSDLNVVRNRAGLPALASPVDNDALLAWILAERRSELFTEWAHRWLDLRRFNQLDPVMGAAKKGWRASAALFPIPQGELNLNRNLSQNPGY